MAASGGPQVPEAVRLVGVGRTLGVGMDDLAARLSRRVRVPCRVDGESRIEPALLPGREQGDADALLVRLEAGSALPREITVAIVAQDLAIPIFTFVFGRARQGGQAALVSLARLDPAFYGLPPDRELLTHRALVEVVHELGHVASLAHCPDAACIMSFAGSVERVDVRGADFCAACASRLPPWIVRPVHRE
jgi:archaemetzincin